MFKTGQIWDRTFVQSNGEKINSIGLIVNKEDGEYYKVLSISGLRSGDTLYWADSVMRKAISYGLMIQLA